MSIPMTLQSSERSREIALCSCGRTLTRHDFTTDPIGRTVTACPNCGPKLLLLRHDVPIGNGRPEVRNHFVPKTDLTLPPCSCGNPVEWCGRSKKPTRCHECQRKERNERNRTYWARRKAREAAR